MRWAGNTARVVAVKRKIRKLGNLLDNLCKKKIVLVEKKVEENILVLER
jgi:hypothetical protein